MTGGSVSLGDPVTVDVVRITGAVMTVGVSKPSERIVASALNSPAINKKDTL